MGTVKRSWRLEKRGDPLEDIAAQGQFSGDESCNMCIVSRALENLDVRARLALECSTPCWLRRNSRPPSSCLPTGKAPSV
jgi:hypothetical protein